MKNSKLTTLLKTFSKEEMKRFGLFIDSPYFHTGRNLKPLYLLLKKNHPEFKSEKLLEEQIFRKLSLKEKFDKKKFSAYLRVLFTEMTKLANQFLVFEKFATIDEGYIFAY